jgi:predicted transposase/invertase (TIGR01784 family)
MKVLTQLYENKSLSAYGLDIPRIKQMLPTNFPAVTANEYRGDNAFLLEDDSLYIQEYSSTVEKDEDFVKYTDYVSRAYKQLKTMGVKVRNIIIGVIYTGDILTAPAVWDTGALIVTIKQVFLAKFDTETIYSGINTKINTGENLTDEEMLKLIILPLTQPNKDKKQKLIEDTVNLAKRLPDEKQHVFAIAVILAATDKFIDRGYSDQIKEWIRMTKVARLFEEEKIEAVNVAVKAAVNAAFNATRHETSIQIARSLLLEGVDYLRVMKCTGLTRDEVQQL